MGSRTDKFSDREPVQVLSRVLCPASLFPLRLYERLGFRQIDDRGVYLFMEWRDDNSQRSNDPTIQGKRFDTMG